MAIMRRSSLECYQLIQLTLRMLPPYCLVCFSAVLLALRSHIGFAKTRLDTLTISLTKDYIYLNGIELSDLLFWTSISAIYLQLGIGILLALLILLQMAGLAWPACLFQFYPNYHSYKLKMKKSTSDTARFIYAVGSLAFFASLILGLCICTSSRREITKQKTSHLADSIRSAMKQYKLHPWNNMNVSNALDKIQGMFKCCGLNGYHDYMLQLKPVGVTWEQHYYDRSTSPGSESVWNYPMSCCATTEAGEPRNCNKVPDLHKLGCYVRVLQFMKYRQATAEHWSFSIGACIAAMGSMAYWAQAM